MTSPVAILVSIDGATAIASDAGTRALIERDADYTAKLHKAGFTHAVLSCGSSPQPTREAIRAVVSRPKPRRVEYVPFIVQVVFDAGGDHITDHETEAGSRAYRSPAHSGA